MTRSEGRIDADRIRAQRLVQIVDQEAKGGIQLSGRGTVGCDLCFQTLVELASLVLGEGGKQVGLGGKPAVQGGP